MTASLRSWKSLVDGYAPCYLGRMEPWATELLDLWRTNTVRTAETFLEGFEKNPDMPVKGYALEDLVQMVAGAGVMIAEELSGGERESWETYMSTVIPGLIAQGQPLHGLVRQITINGILVQKFLVPLASETHREQISTYLTNFFASFNAESVKAGLDYLIKR